MTRTFKSTMMFLTLLSLSSLTSTMKMVNAWSTASSKTSFTGRPCTISSTCQNNKGGWVMYDSSHDPPNDSKMNPWTVLSTTEEWISTTLHNSNAGTNNNPYSRKEVSYVCEGSSDPALIVSNLFRRLKDARASGERHGEEQVERAEQMGSSYEPSTYRQTQVLVIPSNSDFQDNFLAFDAMMEAINQARRQARDYVTEAHWDRIDAASTADEDDDDEPLDWSVAVNCAHLHPKYGVQKTPKQQLQELKEEEEAGEVDVHYQEYQKKRLLARQSPYPTVVIEVRATPPPDFGMATPPPPPAAASKGSKDKGESAVTAADILKLEQLFGQAAHVNHPTKHTSDKQEEEAFYSAIGKEKTITELSAMTPLSMAQSYLATVDPTILTCTAAFTESSTAAVDEAYEFIFTNVAMLLTQTLSAAKAAKNPDVRHYVVLPRFVTSAATSLEKFAKQCSKILSTLPGDHYGNIELTTYHPEHVHENKRSPMPIVLLKLKNEDV